MKTRFLVALLTLSANVVAFAGPKLSDLPNDLHCAAMGSTNSIVASFAIHDLAVEQAKGAPWLSIDARAEFATEFQGVFALINANNGCDNNYDIAFAAQDLVHLKQGKRKEVLGFMKYFNAESECIDRGCDITSTEIIRCQLGPSAGD